MKSFCETCERRLPNRSHHKECSVCRKIRQGRTPVVRTDKWQIERPDTRKFFVTVRRSNIIIVNRLMGFFSSASSAKIHALNCAIQVLERDGMASAFTRVEKLRFLEAEVEED